MLLRKTFLALLMTVVASDRELDRCSCSMLNIVVNELALLAKEP